MKRKTYKTYLRLSSTKKRSIASTLLVVFLFEILNPASLYALSGGPGQPEMSSFEPVSTNQMVDLFSGDFTYNIPLLDVEGYPINIAYHGGPTMEQEASWVGLGWNINPGVINRAVRGLPDDFNGDVIEKDINLKPQKEFSLTGGAGGEIIGLNADFGMALSYHNYKGFFMAPEMSLGVSMGGNKNSSIKFLSYSGKTGFDIGITYSYQGNAASASAGLTYNSRDQSTTISVQASLDFSGEKKGDKKRHAKAKRRKLAAAKKKAEKQGKTGADAHKAIVAEYKRTTGQQKQVRGELLSGGSSWNIGNATYIPTGKQQMMTKMGSFRGMFGAEVFGGHGYIYVSGGYNEQGIKNPNADESAFGYLYLENAYNEALTDFNRDQDKGSYNPMQEYLAPSTLTYDLLNVSGQGASGAFRPFRNDVGAVHDPNFEELTSAGGSVGAEVGVGNTAKYGGNVMANWGKDKGGKWSETNDYTFSSNKEKDLFEKVYYKNAGEITASNQSFYSQIKGKGEFNPGVSSIHSVTRLRDLPKKNTYGTNDIVNRHPRGKYISYLTADEAKACLQEHIENDGTDIIRSSGSRKGYHVSEYTHYEKNGSRYVYGIPAYNLTKTERSFTTNEVGTEGIVKFIGNDNSLSNTDGKDNFYQEVKTPAYAHSYLLTGYLSADYVDVLSDGITDDDLGQAVKFNWKMKHANYRWRTPLTGVADEVAYSEGLKVRGDDNKGSYVEGTKEIWYLKSVESRNFIAVFNTAPREDGVDVTTSGALGSNKLEKLESIVLYSKAEYNANASTAKPIKTIEFTYLADTDDHVLCQQTPNSTSSGKKGKLTLSKISMHYGDNEYGKFSPYKFKYSLNESGEYDTDLKKRNPDYSRKNVDRWGNYKGENPANGNSGYNGGRQLFTDYPYSNQYDGDLAAAKANNDLWASAWMLSEISLPSGGKINLQFESDDYTHVQNKPAMQFYRVVGAGDEEAFDNGTELYGFAGVNQRDLVYIESPQIIKDMNTAGTYSHDDMMEVLGKMFSGIEYINYKFMLLATAKPSITNPITAAQEKFEKVRGYAARGTVGFCNNGAATPVYDYNHIFVHLKHEKIKGQKLNPIVAKGIQFMDKNLHDYINDGQNPDENGGVMNIVKQMFSIIYDMKKLVQGPVRYYFDKEVAKRFRTEESFIRLNIPVSHKFGGGHRVKQVKLTDGWATSTSSGEMNNEYGQDYKYTLKDGVTSSGIASYEPLAGGDENPFRRPTFHKEKKNAFLAVNWQITEEHPFGETFMPPANVGYSRVEVSSIHRTDEKVLTDPNDDVPLAKSAQSFTVHKFYTANEFPMQIKVSKMSKQQRKNHLSALTSVVGVGKQDRYSAAQGYSFVFNDMHGKDKSVENFVVVDPTEDPRRISGKKYNYKISKNSLGQVELDNKVHAILRNGDGGDEELYDMGREIDICVDSRYYEHNDGNPTVSFNTDGFFVAAFPVIIPTGFSPGTNNKLAVRSVVVTKIIQENGILSDIVQFDENREVTTANELYDGNTGEVLMTSTKNEFDDKLYSYNRPAYWVNKNYRMGPAYINTGYFQTAGDEVTVLNGCSSSNARQFLKNFLYKGLIDGLEYNSNPPYTNYPFTLNSITGNIMKKDVFISGDEVLVKGTNGDFKAWVISKLGQSELDHLYNKGLISSNATISNVDGSSNSNPCSDALDETEFRQRLKDLLPGTDDADITGVVLGSGTGTSALKTYGDNYNVCDLLSYYPVNAKQNPTSYINSGNMGLYNALLTETRVCNYLKMIYGSGNKIDYLRANLASWLNDKKTLDIFSTVFNDPQLSEYMVCNTAHPAIMEFLGQLMCDKYLFDLVRFSVVNMDVPFDLRTKKETNYSHSQDENQNDVTTKTTPDPSWTVTSYTKKSVTLTCGKNVTDADKHYLHTATPQVDVKIMEKACSERITVPCKKSIGLASSYSVVKTDVTITSTEASGCPVLPNASFDANVEEVVIFMDKYGKLVSGDIAGKVVKIVRSGRRNQLEHKASTIVTWNQNEVFNSQALAYQNVLSAEATDYSEDWHAEKGSYKTTDDNGDPLTGYYIPNPYLHGNLGNYRVKESHTYVAERIHLTGANSTTNSAQDGLYKNYTSYWDNWTFNAGPVLNRLVVDEDIENSKWVTTSIINLYSTLGYAIEETNPLNISSAEVFGNHNQARVVGANAKVNQLAFEDFEEYLSTVHERQEHFDFYAKMKAIHDNASHTCMINTGEAHTGKQSLYLKGDYGVSGSFYEEKAEVIGSQTQKSINVGGVNHFYEAVSHTECSSSETSVEYIVELDARTGFDGLEYKNPVFKPAVGESYIFSGWVKDAYNDEYVFIDANDDPVLKSFNNTADIKVHCYNSSNVATTVDLTNLGTSPFINGWRKFEKSFPIPTGTVKIGIELSGGDFGAYFDDFRLFPSEGNMTSYVYDTKQFRLKAQLDENNYATFYEYDSEGNLIRVKKETERGIVLLKEYKKHVIKQTP